jgi:hypothetical protein
LVQPPIADTTLSRLARLARLEERRPREIQTPAAWATARRTHVYCARCLFVNPVDVTAPRWKREWLDPHAALCKVHGTPLASIASSALRSCQNFDQTLKVVGRLELERSRDAKK